ncbi:MAG: glycosyltransferase [Ilumatobacteraceae bacterium]
MADHASTSDPAPARHHRVLVVMPTYDEAANIIAAVAAVRRRLPDAEIVVVDDGSPDGTADLVAGLAADDPAIHLLRRSGKAGLDGDVPGRVPVRLVARLRPPGRDGRRPLP